MLESRTIEQLPEAVVASSAAMLPVQEPGAPARRIAVGRLLAQLHRADVSHETRAELYADLAHVAGSIGLVFADPTPGYEGYYQKSGAPGAGAWALVGADALALREDLADEPGFTLIKHKRGEAGTYARTAAQMDAAGMFGPGLSVMHFIDPDYDEYIRERTLAGVSLSASFNLALDACLVAGEGEVSVPAGEFPLAVTSGPERCILMPVGSNLRMDDRAWLLPVPSSTAIIAKGSNRIKANIDGRALIDGNTPDQAWLFADAAIPNGIRAYANADHGLGATDVTIEGSNFRNLRYAIQTEGAKRWLVARSRFERMFWSAILMGSNTGQSCLHNLIPGNFFEDIGDYAAAFYELGGNSNGESAFNLIGFNQAERCNLRTNGHAFGWETGQVALQHHNQIVSNIYERGRADITFCRGLAVLQTCSDSAIQNNVAKGAGSTSSADEAITAYGSKRIRIAGNNVADYRGSAIAVDGCDGVLIESNPIHNCGGNGNAYPIRFALNLGGRAIKVAKNPISYSSDYAGYTAGIASIGGYMLTAGQTLRDIAICDNMLDRPHDIGVLVLGYDGSNLAVNVSVTGNSFTARESEDPVSTFFESAAVQVQYAQAVHVSANKSWDAKKGFDLRNLNGLTLNDNQFNGGETLAWALKMTGSQNIRSAGNRINQNVTARIDGGATPASLTNAMFAWGDDFFLNVDAADNAAAAAAGVSIGMDFHNAGARRVRTA